MGTHVTSSPANRYRFSIFTILTGSFSVETAPGVESEALKSAHSASRLLDVEVRWRRTQGAKGHVPLLRRLFFCDRGKIYLRDHALSLAIRVGFYTGIRIKGSLVIFERGRAPLVGGT